MQSSNSHAVKQQQSTNNILATVVQGHTFTISDQYSPIKILGKGSFGIVCSAYDSIRESPVAIKRIRPFGNDEWDARHCHRLRMIPLRKIEPPGR